MKTFPENTGPGANRRLILGHISLSFHAASAALIAETLARRGVTVEIREAAHERMFDMLASGEVDLLASAWLPGSHGEYLEPIVDRVEKLTVLYEPYAHWGVPDYVPAGLVSSVADLMKPEVVARMENLIQGIGPGAGISRFSREIMKAYALEEAGYEFRNGSQEDMERAFESAVEKGRWVIVPLWRPQHLHFTHAIRELREPRGLLRGRDEATLLIRRETLPLLPGGALETLRRIRPGNAVMTELDHLINVRRRSPREAALDWMERNPNTVRAWLS